MRRVRIPNPRLTSSEKTFIDADYIPASSGTSLTVISNLGFAQNDYGVAGEVGDEKTEAGIVSSVSGNDTIVTTAALKFSHNKGITLYRSEWGQVSIERQLGANGAWSVLITQNIQWDKLDTIYIDPTGTDNHNYRFRFYNPASSTYSEYSPTVKGSGFDRNQVGAMIINVRRKIKDPNRLRFQDSEIIQKLQDGQENIVASIKDLWFLKVDAYEQANGVSTVANTSRYSLSQYTDLNYVDKVKYKYSFGSNVEVYELDGKNDSEFDEFDQNIAVPNYDDNAMIFKQLPPDSNSSTGYLKIYPYSKTNSGILYPIYFRKMTALVDVADATDCPFPEILEDYAAWKLHDLMGNDKQAAKYRDYYYGPNAESASDQLSGLALLRSQNGLRKETRSHGKVLIRYRGRRMNRFFAPGIRNRDYIKENYMD